MTAGTIRLRAFSSWACFHNLQNETFKPDPQKGGEVDYLYIQCTFETV